jgi:hypothetical protein
MPVIQDIQEAEIGRITVQGQPGQKVSETLPTPKNKLGVVVHVCNPSHLGGIGRRIMVQS